jgi:hypothetical protein
MPSGNTYTSSQLVSLSAGWNLVAAPYPTHGVMTDAIAGQVGPAVTEIATYSNGSYRVYVPGMGSPFLVTASSGMWIACTSPTVWTPK